MEKQKDLFGSQQKKKPEKSDKDSKVKSMRNKLKIYSTLTRRKETFKPIEEGNVKMYACGITVDGEAHVGHARQAIVFDVIRKYLESLEFKVNYVRNFTDIDDKIIKKAQEIGETTSQVSERNIQGSLDDLRKLKVSPATHEPKVTEHIKDIVDFIQILINKGYAYANDDGVFFAVRKFEGYGKLSKRNITDLRSVEDKVEGKQDPEDFALWKPAKEGEPNYDSPWGKGRPGWHIECSALAKKYLGDSIDIHGGGLDLIFPHHENEIAQSEAANSRTFSRYWIHNGLVMIDGQKMSKSLKNSLTIKELLKEYPPDVVRFTILSFNYTSPIDFSTELFRNVNKQLFNFYTTLKNIDQFIEETPGGDRINHLEDIITQMLQDFNQTMQDSFNTAKALGKLSKTFQKVNAFLYSKNIKPEDKVASLKVFREGLKQITDILKILDEDPTEFLRDSRNRFLKKHNISLNKLEEDIKDRKEAKASKDYARADEIRKKWQEKNIILKDLPCDNMIWDIIL